MTQPKLILQLIENPKTTDSLGKMSDMYNTLITSTVDETNNAVGIFDDRYRDMAKLFAGLFTEKEYTNIRYNCEIVWLAHAISYYTDLSKTNPDKLTKIKAELITQIKELTPDDFICIKKLERETKHDVKAIEQFIKKQIALTMPDFEYNEWVHICLTSQDINSCALAKMVINFKLMFKAICNPISTEIRKFIDCEKIIMLAHTHGQIAIPTTLNKEFKFHHNRIFECYNRNMFETPCTFIDNLPVHVKFGGAIGSWAAGCFAFPNVTNYDFNPNFVEHQIMSMKKADHIYMVNDFIDNMFSNYRSYISEEHDHINVQLTTTTTQIDDYSWLVNILNRLCLFCSQIKNFADYIRALIHDEYIVQAVIATETGSSTMPQKVNPIYFENVKANALLAISTFRSVSDILMSSEYQRDMSDSTALRTLSTGMGYLSIVLCNFYEGLTRIQPNHAYIKEHLLQHPEVIMEAVQTICRKHNYKDSYDKAKDFIRHISLTTGPITLDSIRTNYISKLDIPEPDKTRIMNLSPEDYIGWL